MLMVVLNGTEYSQEYNGYTSWLQKIDHEESVNVETFVSSFDAVFEHCVIPLTEYNFRPIYLSIT